MKVHEYQAKKILKDFNIPTLKGSVCFTLDEALNASKSLGYPCAVKAQIHAGGRGKGGGVKIAKNEKELKEYSESILGMMLKTPQTSSDGQLVRSVLIEQGCEIAKEVYVSALLDREKSMVCIMACAQGGMDIEEVAAKDPSAIIKEWIDPTIGFMPFQARKLAHKLGFSAKTTKQSVKFFNNLYKAFIKTDASLIEINPLVITKEDDLIALDAKMTFDDNGLYRQANIAQMRDPAEEDAKELRASQHGLSYIALEGNIGCMVNGAGLAMATMDIIKSVGGAPANFLDVGGSATQEKVCEALKIILEDKSVKAIFVNIFGGIAKCDVIAGGIVGAVNELGLHVPLVVRLQGTNVEIGKSLLKDSKLKIIAADDMLDGAKKSVAAANNSSI